MAYSINAVNSKSLWENFRQRHCPQALFQGWLWGEVQLASGNKLWRWGIFDGQELIGIFQVSKTEARRGSFLHVRHGPVLAGHAGKIWKSILGFFSAFAREQKCWFIRVSPLIADSPKMHKIYKEFGLVPAAMHAMDAELAWVLDIDKSEEELLAGMRKTTRYEIRQAQKLGVEVSKTQNPADLATFLRLYHETSERHGFVPHQGVSEEFRIYCREGSAVLLLGKHQSRVISGAIILFDGNQAIYHHGASILSKVPAAYLVQWEAIKEAKKRRLKLYNFWGIAPEDKPNHPWRGITLFKTGFGGRQAAFLHAHDLPIDQRYFFTRTVETLRRIAKGY